MVMYNRCKGTAGKIFLKLAGEKTQSVIIFLKIMICSVTRIVYKAKMMVQGMTFQYLNYQCLYRDSTFSDGKVFFQIHYSVGIVVKNLNFYP